MSIIFKVILIFHIIGGTIGLLTGILNILRKKGDKNHKLVGKVFFTSMMTAGVSSLILASIHTNYFLFMVGVFTLYMVGSGQLYLKHNASPISNRIGLTITTLMLIAGVLFIGFGVLVLIKTKLFGLVFITFGGVGLLFVRQDFINHKVQSAIKNYWLIAHLQRMTGGFIASMTAFLVIIAKYFPQQIPGFVYWLLPTFIFTPLIINWSRKYEAK